MKSMILKMSVLLALVSLSLVSNEISFFKDKYLDIVNKYNNGTVYLDQTASNQDIIRFFKEKNPFKDGIPFSIDEVDLNTLRDRYLELIRHVMVGVLDMKEYRGPNHPVIKDYEYSHIHLEGFDTLHKLMLEVEQNGIKGDFVEAGVWRGGVTMYMKAFLDAYEIRNRKVWVADSFDGWPPATDDPDSKVCNNQNLPWIVVSDTTVKNNFMRWGLLDENVIFLKGWFKDTLQTAPIEKIAILRIDADLYEPTKEVLDKLYPKLAVGGYVIIDDYNCFPGCNRAVDEYRMQHNIHDPLFPQGTAVYKIGVCWRKSHK